MRSLKSRPQRSRRAARRRRRESSLHMIMMLLSLVLFNSMVADNDRVAEICGDFPRVDFIFLPATGTRMTVRQLPVVDAPPSRTHRTWSWGSGRGGAMRSRTATGNFVLLYFLRIDGIATCWLSCRYHLSVLRWVIKFCMYHEDYPPEALEEHSCAACRSASTIRCHLSVLCWVIDFCVCHKVYPPEALEEHSCAACRGGTRSMSIVASARGPRRALGRLSTAGDSMV